MADALDAAVAGAAVVDGGAPVWWRLVGFVQWALLAIAGLGGLWLGLLAGASYLRLATPDPPQWGAVPWPTGALIGGVVLGLAVAGASRIAARVGARRQARRATARLRATVAAVADRVVVAPVDEVLDALVRTRDAAQVAAGGRRGRRSNG